MSSERPGECRDIRRKGPRFEEKPPLVSRQGCTVNTWIEWASASSLLSRQRCTDVLLPSCFGECQICGCPRRERLERGGELDCKTDHRSRLKKFMIRPESPNSLLRDWARGAASGSRVRHSGESSTRSPRPVDLRRESESRWSGLGVECVTVPSLLL